MCLKYLGIVLIGFFVAPSAAILQNHVVNGSFAANYQFPWHVSLTITVTNSASPRYCGGSLIGSHYILTAATCLLNAQSIMTDLGSIYFSTPLNRQTTNIFVIHPQFNSNYNENNIALIRLHDEIWYTNEKRAILLAGQSKLNDTFVNTSGYISGFGVYQNEDNHMSENLRFAYLNVISNDQCRLNFVPSYIRNETMCTMGYNNTYQTGCYGDTGGPLVTLIGGIWYQIGVISTIHGSGCSGVYPNLHTRVAPYVQWIYQMTNIPINP